MRIRRRSPPPNQARALPAATAKHRATAAPARRRREPGSTRMAAGSWPDPSTPLRSIRSRRSLKSTPRSRARARSTRPTKRPRRRSLRLRSRPPPRGRVTTVGCASEPTRAQHQQYDPTKEEVAAPSSNENHTLQPKKKNTAFLSPLHIPAQHASSHGLRDGFIHRAGKEKQKLASLRVRHPESMNPARFLGVPHSPQIGSLPQREAFRGPPEHLRSAHAAAEPRPKTGERCTAPLSWSCSQGSPSSASGGVDEHLFPRQAE